MAKLVLTPIVLLVLLILYTLFEVPLVDFLANNWNNGLVSRYCIWRLESNSRRDKVIAALNSKQSKTRYFAIVKVGTKRWTEASTELIPLLSDPEKEVAKAAIVSAGQLQDPILVDGLAKVLGTDKRWRLRRSAARALRYYKEPKAVRALLRSLDVARKSGKKMPMGFQSKMINTIMESILAQGHGLAKDVYINLCIQHRKKKDCVRAITLIRELGIFEGAPQVAAGLGAKAAIVRAAAAECLGRIGDDSHIPALKKLLKKERDRSVKEAAKAALKKLGG